MATAQELENLNILVLDDDPSILMLLKLYIKKFGFKNVTLMDHSLEAVKHIRDNPIDIIFSDVNMPECDGIELCVHLAHMQYQGALVFVTVTDELTKDCIRIFNEEQHHLNLLGIISKPVNLKEIKKILEQVTTNSD